MFESPEAKNDLVQGRAPKSSDEEERGGSIYGMRGCT